MTNEIRALLAQMAKELDNYLQRTACDPKVVHPLATRARVALAAEPHPPAAPGRRGGGVSKRKIIQMVVDNSSSRCNYIYGLCNDGTILGFDDIPTGQWRILPAIPQPAPTEPPTDD